MPRVNGTFTNNAFEHIDGVCKTRGISNSEYVRELYFKGKEVYGANEGIELITEIIDERLRAILTPQIERLASIGVKGSIMSATSTFLNAQAIADFIPKDKQREFREVYEKARLKGISYVKNRTYYIEDIKEKMIID